MASPRERLTCLVENSADTSSRLGQSLVQVNRVDLWTWITINPWIKSHFTQGNEGTGV